MASQTLDTVNGRSFNRIYIEQMIIDHQQTIRLFLNEVRAGSDPEIKAFAQAELPRLRRHLLRAIRERGFIIFEGIAR